MKAVIGSAVIALVAAVSSVICARIGVPVWSMFIGWIAFVAGGASARSAAPTWICAVLGVVLGFVGAAVIGGGAAGMGADLSLLVGVFVIVFAALLAQHVPFVNLVICYFIGMTTFFASSLAPTVPTLLLLGGGLLIGVLSGLIAVTLAGMIGKEAAAEAPHAG